MNLELEGRNCVVLGGSRGIGRAISLGLVAEGANVAICGRDEESLGRAEAELQAGGTNIFAQACDIADPEALVGFLGAARQSLGSVDVLVHNASALAVGSDLQSWEASLEVDLMAAVRAVDHVLPGMVDAGGGAILFISSISGLEADPFPAFGYAAAKAAQIAYAKKLALIHAPQGIRVNAIAPGSIEFPGGIWSSVREEQPDFYESVRASIPWGRLGTPEEVADVAVFLLSPRSSWVTGECLSVDGGQHRGMR